jgi:hypothetical protein
VSAEEYIRDVKKCLFGKEMPAAEKALIKINGSRREKRRDAMWKDRDIAENRAETLIPGKI